MNPRLQQIARELNRKKPAAEKAPASDLGDAISQLIAEQVEQRVSQELGKQQDLLHNPRLRRILKPPAPVPPTDFKQLPPPPTTALPPMGAAIVERDELGRAVQVVVEGRGSLRVERDSLGRISRMVPADAVSPQPDHEGEER